MRPRPRAELRRLQHLHAPRAAALTVRRRRRPALLPIRVARATAHAAYCQAQAAARAWAVEEEGIVAPVAVLLLLVLLGFCALVLDVGLVYAHRRALQNATDAAALAAARELQRELLGASGDPAGLAERFAGHNGVPAETGDCTRSDTSTLVANRAGTLPHSWEVEASRVVPLVFGRAVGVAQLCVRARALGVVVELRETKIWPFGILQSTPRTPNVTVTLKQAAGGSSNGNYGLVDFDCAGGGSEDYRYWAFNGFGTRAGETVPARVPPNTWTICTETGNKVSENRALADYVAQQQAIPCPYGVADIRCPLYGLVPIIGEATWPSGTKAIPVVDFAVFRLAAVRANGGGTGQMEITGSFLELAGGVGPTYIPDPDGELRGIIGVRLWQ